MDQSAAVKGSGIYLEAETAFTQKCEAFLVTR